MSTATVRRLNPEPQVTVERITPGKAQTYLDQNTHNRPMRQRSVDAYARDITNGDWAWNGEGIKFDVDGVLLDGQHRLAAIAQAGKPVRMLVVRGLPRSTQETMDGGAKRRFSDVLALRGEDNYTTLSTVVRAVTTYEAGGIGANANGATNAEMFATLEKYPWLRDGLSDIARATSSARLPATVGGLCWWLFMQLDPEDAQFFFERLASDQGHAEGDPIYVLRRTLMLASDDGIKGNRNKRLLTALVIKAWNKYRAGEQIGLLKFRAGGARPEAFPEPR